MDFTGSRDDRTPFVTVSETPGSWNWANVQSAGGGCLIVGDKLHFYVSGRQGEPGTNRPGVCSTGLATLRRDGFASMDWRNEDRRPRLVPPGGRQGGYLTTRRITFGGGHLFVNADVARRAARRGAGCRRPADRAVHARELPAPARRCHAIHGVVERRIARQLAGRQVKLRFWLEQGRLYAFWISRWPTGESGGATAGGGPEFAGTFDERRSALLDFKPASP